VDPAVGVGTCIQQQPHDVHQPSGSGKPDWHVFPVFADFLVGICTAGQQKSDDFCLFCPDRPVQSGAGATGAVLGIDRNTRLHQARHLLEVTSFGCKPEPIYLVHEFFSQLSHPTTTPACACWATTGSWPPSNPAAPGA
jgi:hypothetical protein